MKFFFSINTRTQYEACILYSNNIDGVEVFVKEINNEYFDLLKKNNFKAQQIHMPDFDKLNNELIGEINKFKKTLLVFHPSTLDYKTDIKTTAKKMKEIINSTNHSVALENLNSLHKRRLDTYDVCKAIKKVNGLMLCWDVGHEIMSNGNADKCPIKPATVHIHDLHNGDHYPFYYNNVDYKKVIKYLKAIGFDGNIVLEVAFDYLKGSTMKEKIKEYMNQISLLRCEA